MKKNIDIKEPCSENWAQMTPTQKGAFCDKCALEVYDFSTKSGDEIRDILKLNLGSAVCGRLKPSQLNDLNVDFNAWNMNSKRSFQSALVFSLIVAFGMTLFGCEEDEEEKIKEIQTVGMSFIDGSAAESYRNFDASTEVAISEIGEPVKLNVPVEVPIERERLVMGRMMRDIPDEPPVDLVVPVDDIIAGGIGYSHDYIKYLDEVRITDHTVIEDKLEFSAFAFPNPAQDQTTLKVTLPKASRVQIKLYNISGQFIKEINSKRLPKGETNLPINLIDLPTGTYIVSIVSKNYNESVKFIKR